MSLHRVGFNIGLEKGQEKCHYIVMVTISSATISRVYCMLEDGNGAIVSPHTANPLWHFGKGIQPGAHGRRSFNWYPACARSYEAQRPHDILRVNLGRSNSSISVRKRHGGVLPAHPCTVSNSLPRPDAVVIFAISGL